MIMLRTQNYVTEMFISRGSAPNSPAEKKRILIKFSFE